MHSILVGEIFCTKYETRSQKQLDQEADEKTSEQASNTNYMSKNGKISEKQTPDGKSGFSERPSSIGVGGTRPFFYMVDQYFGNDSLEPFECIFMAPLTL